MSKPVKIILIVVVAIVIIGVAGNMIKSDVHVERSKVIKASVAELQKQATDFNEFQTWSPWADLDPNATNTVEGPQGAVGAKMSWSGNDEVGTGYQEVKSITPERIDLDLVFTAPWESQSVVYYTFEEQEGGVNITWGYDGDMPILMGLFMDMDEMLGGQYEKGLNSLQAKLEN